MGMTTTRTASCNDIIAESLSAHIVAYRENVETMRGFVKEAQIHDWPNLPDLVLRFQDAEVRLSAAESILGSAEDTLAGR